MASCKKCGKPLGGVYRGVSSPTLDKFIFPCYDCRILVNGYGEKVDSKLSRTFFKMANSVKKLEIGKENLTDMLIASKDLFGLVWRHGAKSFSDDLLGGIILAAAERTGIEVDEKKIAKFLGSSETKMQKKKSDVLEIKMD